MLGAAQAAARISCLVCVVVFFGCRCLRVAGLKQTSDGFGGICVSRSHTFLLIQIPPFVLLVRLLAAAQLAVSLVAFFIM
jgi:hypothetical protein